MWRKERAAESVRWFFALLLCLQLACQENAYRPGPVGTHPRLQRGLSVPSAVLASALGKAKSGEVLVGVGSAYLPYTKKHFWEFKLLDETSHRLRRLGIDGVSLLQTDVTSLKDAESKLRKSTRAGLSFHELAKLKPTGNDIIVWLRTSHKTKLPVAATKADRRLRTKSLGAVARSALKAQIQKIKNVSIVKESQNLPMVRIRGTKAGVLALGRLPLVAAIERVRSVKTVDLSAPISGEQAIVGWPSLLEQLDPPITNEVRIAIWERCHPDFAKLGVHNPRFSSVEYLPRSMVTLHPGEDTCLLPGVGGNPATTIRRRHHANKVHSVLYGRPDAGYDPPRGLRGMLHALNANVTSMATLAIHGSRGLPGASCSSGDDCCNALCSNSVCAPDIPCAPTQGDLIEALAALFGSDNAPDIFSISVALSYYPDIYVFHQKEASLYQHVLDWLSVQYGTLIIHAAGNNGYEPHLAWSGTKPQIEAMVQAAWKQALGSNLGDSSSSEQSVQPALNQSCFDEVDNDNDGLVDCHDPDCSNHWTCQYAHYVIPKLRNALVVGGVDTMGDTGDSPELHRMGGTYPDGSIPTKYDGGVLTPGWSTSYQTLGNSFSSWRTAPGNMNDRRLPHVVAPGRSLTVASSVEAEGYPDSYPLAPPMVVDTMYWYRYYTDPSNEGATTGTSFSTPFVAGLAAYALRHVRQTFGAGDPLVAPQIVRALVMATAEGNPRSYHYQSPGVWGWSRSRLVTGESDARGNMRKHRDGAGEVSASALARVLRTSDDPSTRQWTGFSVFIPDGSPTPPGPKVTDVYTPEDLPPGATTRPLRVAIAWNPPETACASPSTCAPDERNPQGYDLDLCVFKVNGEVDGPSAPHDDPADSLMKCAASWENNYEFLEVDVPNAVFYNKIFFYSVTPNTTVRIGHAIHWLPINP